MRKHRTRYLWILLCVLFLFTGCSKRYVSFFDVDKGSKMNKMSTIEVAKELKTVPVSQYTWLAGVPEYSDVPYAVVHENKPFFNEEDYNSEPFESYAELDKYGRCGVASALVGVETLPKERRGSIGEVKPSGWHTIRYDNVIGDKYLYNRCHLIAFELTGENANPNNLITGTRYMNVEGMLPFENRVANYVKETKNHVLYRVTPIFDGRNLVASGVLMEAYSIEDNGAGVMFNVYCYNVQPGIGIDYSNGDSWLIDGNVSDATKTHESVVSTYILNTNSKKFHKPDCTSVGKMSDRNKKKYTGDRRDVITEGYAPCKMCKP